MSRRRPSESVLASPVLIGASTVLVIVVAVFLAYNANSGLPFVPTYTLKAQVPNAANLVVGNEVRIAGTRVGLVSAIAPQQDPRTGGVSAMLTLALQRSVKPLPLDSSVIVRARSALGLKYVELTKGSSARGYADGATLPLQNATPVPVEIDNVFNTFNAPTRQAMRENTLELGNALAGRGESINQAIVSLRPLLTNLVPVARYLADPSTRLSHLFVSLENVASIVVPAAETQARGFDELDTTFTALAAVARPFIQDTIANAPAALDAGTNAFVQTRPFLDNASGLFADLRPGVAALRAAAPPLADALTIGRPVLRRSVGLSNRLGVTFDALRSFSSDPLVPLGLSRLNDFSNALRPTVAALSPEQTVCNYLTLWFRNVSSLLSEGDSNGTWQRFIIVVTPQGPNNEGSFSSAPANGPSAENHYHGNPYPYVAAPGQPRACEAANEPYLSGQTVIGNTQSGRTTNHDATKRSLSQ